MSQQINLLKSQYEEISDKAQILEQGYQDASKLILNSPFVKKEDLQVILMN